MKRVTSMATACVAAVILVLGTSVGAQDFNIHEKTFLTFSNSVEMPGMTLPAGTYTFKLADTPSRNVVQVLSQDEKQIHGQFLFIQAERPEISGETVITFRETREGTTPAIQYWYYPGEKIGKEFIYPKDQAMSIAARTGGTVMTDDGPISANSTASSTDAQGQVTEWKREQTTTEPSNAPVTGSSGVSQGADVAAAEPANEPAPEPAPEPAAVASAEPSPRPDHSPEPVGTSGVRDAQLESVDARAELPTHGQPACTQRSDRAALAGRRDRAAVVPRLARFARRCDADHASAPHPSAIRDDVVSSTARRVARTLGGGRPARVPGWDR